MANNENKIKYGLKNVFIAKCNETVNQDTGKITYNYEAPKPIKGAVNLVMDPEGEVTPFHADNMVYYRTVSNGGYSGSVEFALIPDFFRKDILREEEDENGVLVETANNADTAKFAMMFQFEGDVKATRHCMHYCTATRPSVSGSTKENGITPQTETLNLSADARDDGLIKVKTGQNTSQEQYDNWFNEPYIPTTISQ